LVLNQINDMSKNTIKNEKRLSEYIQEAPAGILVFDQDYNVLFLNNIMFKFGVLSSEIVPNNYKVNMLKGRVFTEISLTEDLLALRKGKGFEKIIRNIPGVLGDDVSVIIKGAPLLSEDIFAGGILLVEDIRLLNDLKANSRIFDKRFFEGIVERNNALFIVTDNHYRIQYISGSELSLLKKKDIQPENNMLLSTLLKEEVWNSVMTGLKKASREEIRIKFFLKSEKQRRVYETRVAGLRGGGTKISGYLVYLSNINDIQATINSYQKIIEELNLYRVINEAISDAIVGIDTKGCIVIWNEGADLLFGFKRSQVFGKKFGQVIKVWESDFLEKILNETEKRGDFHLKLDYRNKKGNQKIGEFTFNLISDNDDKKLIVRCNDITEKEENERYLKESEERLRNIVENTAELICNFSENGRISFANNAFIETLGYIDSEVKEMSILDFMDAEFIKTKKFTLQDIIESSHRSLELPFKNREGKTIILLASFAASKPSIDGSVTISGIFIDITEKKTAENELLMMRKVFEASNDGIAVACQGAFIMANESFAKLFGYSAVEDLVGLPTISFVDQNDMQKVEKLSELTNLKKDIAATHEFIAIRKDGSKFFAEISFTMTEFNNCDHSIIIARDITERKRTQLVIQDSEEKYRSIAENIEDFFYTMERGDTWLTFVFFTASVEKITGYSQSDFLTDRRLFIRIIYPDDFTEFKNKLKAFKYNFYKNSEEIEYRIIKKDGSVVWVKNKIKSVRSLDGVIQKIYGLVGDVSIQKKNLAELKQTTDNLKKLNDTKDRFISIISHDLRTPFSSILGFTDLVLQDNELSAEEIREYVKYIRESSQNMLSLVNSLLDWTRLQTGRIEFKPAKTEFSKVIEKAIVSMRGMAIKKEIELVSEIQGEEYVFIDSNLILQAINNLMSNALKFTNPGGKIVITSQQSSQARFLEVSVTDTGVGIPEENLSKIFQVDSKFTTEGTGGERGSGLGLSLVREIIERHGGKIWVESRRNEGSSFRFLIPIASATILLVDDNNTDRILYSKILRNIIPEYNVVTASNGEDALKLIAEISPALVVTDHNMPEMTGYDFIRRLMESDIKGKPQVIVLSDFLGKSEKLAFEDIGITYAFAKPVNLNVFKEAIEKSLRKLTIYAN